MYFGVLLYNAREDEIFVLTHNIEDREFAEKYCAKLREDRLPAFTFKHKKKHVADNPEKCAACYKTIARDI